MENPAEERALYDGNTDTVMTLVRVVGENGTDRGRLTLVRMMGEDGGNMGNLTLVGIVRKNGSERGGNGGRQ